MAESEANKSDRGYFGHKTMADGSHVLLTKDEAAEIMARMEASEAKRAADMPTAKDALSELIRAEQRLKDLGWWQGGGLRVRRGDDCAVAEQGSTGMWTGHYQEDGKYVLFGDCVKSPRDVWLKPLGELTPDERAWIAECDKSVSEDIERMGAIMASEDKIDGLMDDPDDNSDCPNCGGEGYVASCFEEYACVDPESGCDHCIRRCDWCNPKADSTR